MSEAREDEERWSFDLQQLGKHLKGDAEVDVIIRGHLYIEHVLIETIKEALQKPNLLSIERIGFPTKVELSAALRLIPEEIIPALKHVNALRNRVAHNLHYEVTRQHKREFYDMFPDIGKALVREKGKPEESNDPEYVNLGHYFMVLAILLDIGRQQYVKWKEQRENAFENAKRVLEKVQGKSELEVPD